MINISDISNTYKIPIKALNLINKNTAELYKIIPLELEKNLLIVGVVNETLELKDALNFLAKQNKIKYKLEKIPITLQKALLKQYTDKAGSLDEAMRHLIDNKSDFVFEKEFEGKSDPKDDIYEELLKDDGPVVNVLNTILEQAVLQKASDVHIEPRETESLVRFRIDGTLKEVLRYPKQFHSAIVARIKLNANLKLDERRRPQDGRFTSIAKTSNKRVDYRVATFPISEGEKIVLRILDKEVGLIPLEALGLTEKEKEKILSAVKRPYGLILITGPTSSGKTTTLYALLKSLDKKTQNFVSLEDPVEYSLEGVNQSNIRPEIGYGFAEGLRAILRGDPNQILVGEIRDKETALLAIQAALTGHTVYSTIHTNTAVGVIARLKNFGVDSFLLAPTLSLVIGQRRAKRLEGESKDIPISDAHRKLIDKIFEEADEDIKEKVKNNNSFKDIVPTKKNPLGTKGTIGIYEVLDVNEEIRNLILNNASEAEIEEKAQKNGMLTLTEDAILKGMMGLIPYFEVAKISSERAFSEAIENYGARSEATDLIKDLEKNKN